MIALAPILEWKLGQVYFDARCRTAEVDGEMVITEWDEEASGRAKPTDAEIAAWTVEWQAAQDATAYQHKRAAEYPAITDQIGAIVKHLDARRTAGDPIDAEASAIIDKVAVVKAKYPKPTK